MSQTISVFEHGTLRVGQGGLTLAALDALARFNDQNQQRYFSVGYRSVSFRQFVGYLQVGNIGIEVLPKVDRHIGGDARRWRQLLHEMLRVGRDLDLLGTEAARQALTQPSLCELVAANFLDQVERIVREGLTRGYRDEENNGTTFRGKLLFPQHLRLNHARRDRCFVRHTVYDRDTPVNRLLLAGLGAAASAPISTPLLARVNVARLALDGVQSLEPDASVFERVKLTRSTDRYRQALLLARMLIEGLSPALRVGRVPVFAFLFDMNMLWERYIAVLFQRASRGRVRVKLQKQGTLLVQGDQTRRIIKPDILVTDIAADRPLALLDTKWKVADARGAHDDHIKQMFVYNEIFGAPRAILLHPAVAQPGITTTGTFWRRTHRCDVLQLGLSSGGTAGTRAITAQIERLIAEIVAET